jgi:hypothetical protein
MIDRGQPSVDLVQQRAATVADDGIESLDIGRSSSPSLMKSLQVGYEFIYFGHGKVFSIRSTSLCPVARFSALNS